MIIDFRKRDYPFVIFCKALNKVLPNLTTKYWYIRTNYRIKNDLQHMYIYTIHPCRVQENNIVNTHQSKEKCFTYLAVWQIKCYYSNLMTDHYLMTTCISKSTVYCCSRTHGPYLLELIIMREFQLI